MTLSLGAARTHPDFLGQRKAPPAVGAAWALLVFNTLGSQGADTIVPIPRPVAQALTMGALLVAFAIALVLNPRLRFRPSAYLLLLTLLLVLSVASSLRLESGYGALFRCFRLAVFVATLWLLTPWWSDAMAFVRHHVRSLTAVLATVAVGLVIAPGTAMPELYGGRLVGAVWPLTPPQVGHYAAVAAGLAALLWLGRKANGRSVLIICVPAVVLLLLSHTRTSTVGLLAGLAVACLALAVTSVRARRVFGWSVIAAGVTAVAFGPAVQAWFLRGQSEEYFTNLTGRETVWKALLAAPRTTGEELFGVGLTNKSFGGEAIDSSWLSIYYEQGLIGIAIVVAFLATLVVVAGLRPPSLARSCAMFLIVYCLIASYTEAGLGDASPYLLNLAVAAALLARPDPAPARGPEAT